MADQKINALPTKTAVTSGDKFLMSGAAEEYLIDYDKLATAMLNQLTSKTFTLDQGTKTLIAALNELNSKSKSGSYKMLFTMLQVPNNTEKDPIAVLKDKWEELDTYTIHIGCIHCSGWYSFIAQKYIDHTYGSAIIFSYNYNKPKYLTLINNVWSEEQEL